MTHFQFVMFSGALVLLIFLSAFFSCAETALMAINRYRLRHRAHMKKRSAVLILNLLKRPDRLLGMILIGNNVSNILASALATLIAVNFWGDKGVIVSTILLTFIVLVFAEVAPKTLAALYPEKISKIVAWPVNILLKIFYPFVWFINAMSNGLLRLFHVKVSAHGTEPLTREELRTLVYETSGRFSHQYQNMLLAILDLNQIAVEDVMIPRHETKGIDIEEDWDLIKKQLATIHHEWIPVYREHIDQVIGLLSARDVTRILVSEKVIDKKILLALLHEPYFVPEGTPLNIQLMNFQKKEKRLAFIVDEYGEILGLLTVEDILEEIVGEFATNVMSSHKVQTEIAGTFLVEGSILIRELNRITHSEFPTQGPRTLNGLITEYLEAIPRAKVCIKIGEYPIEIIRVEENKVKLARLFPKMHK